MGDCGEACKCSTLIKIGCLARIREAVGDPTGVLMQDELVDVIRYLARCAEWPPMPPDKTLTEEVNE